MNSDRPIRVVLADDQRLVRAGFRMILEHGDPTRHRAVEVVAEAGDGAAAISAVNVFSPDVVLMDLRMPVVDGIEATQRIVADPRHADTQIIALTTYDTDQHILEAIGAGAAGFLLKDVDPDELRRAVALVADGQALLSPSVTRQLLAHMRSQHRQPRYDPSCLEVLTDREREMVCEVAHGLSNSEIATQFVLSPATVKTHVTRAITKLGVRDRAQLVVLAYETGLLDG